MGHISEVIRDAVRDVQILVTTPKHGGSQHDHYIYGWPKRDV